MSNEFAKLDSFHLDVLKEVGNIGAGHAATALSSLLNKPIDMNVPSVKILEFNEVADFVGGAEQVVVTVLLQVEGDIPATIFFILSIEAAKFLLKNLAEMDVHEGDFTEIEISALKEIGNILTGSYLSSLADFTKLNLHPSVPQLAIDMAGALLMYGLTPLADYSDYAFVIDTSFIQMDKTIAGHFFLIPQPDSIDRLFESLGVPNK